MRALYPNQDTQNLERFFDSVFHKAEDDGSAFDSATSRQDFAKGIVGEQTDVPASLLHVMKALGDEEGHRALDAVMLGMKAYKEKNGFLPTADVIESALHQGYSVTDESMRARGEALDGIGNSEGSDSISSQPNRAVVAIVTAIAEAIPFATYLPADIGSNESRLVIVSHQAGSTTGEYAAGDLLDGINCGDEYISSERRVQATLNGALDAADAEITAVTGATGAPVVLLRGRTNVFVNGKPVAAENPNVAASVAASPIAGVANINGTAHTIGGTVTVATGVVALTFAPALPAGTEVHVEGFIDFEEAPELAPKVITQAQTFPLYASAWRGIVQQTIDAQTQYAQEIGVDMQSEGLVTVRAQTAMERHYMAIKKLLTVASLNGNVETFDFDAASQLTEKTRAQIIQDILVTIGVASQQMAEDTQEYGIKYIYVGKNMLALLRTLPDTIFKQSGVTERPSIFWAGTLSNGIEVYYSPKHIADSATTSQILCIGRSMQVSRSPIVLGDAVAPMYKQLAVNTDLKSGVGFYARNFTAVNPHEFSSLGCAIVNVTNIQ
jgi:hypothetical protein